MNEVEILESNAYSELITELKAKVRGARLRAAFAVNQELIILYWEIGQSLLEKQKKHSWGDKFIEKVATDLKIEFPNQGGMSLRNIKYMRQFSEKFTPELIGQQLVAQLQIPWGHHTVLLDKNFHIDQYLWYAAKTLENGWSRNILALQIKTDLYARQSHGAGVTNFAKTLAPPQSDLVNEILKDPYILTFVDDQKTERDLERSLVQHIQKFILELGKGFAFIGTQYHLEVGGDDFYIDILFYHLRLKSYVALELKNGKFKPEYAGKMQFYLSGLDAQVKSPDDNPSVGIILCKEKNKIVAEYTLQKMHSPMGVANYEVDTKKLQESLLTKEELDRLVNF